MIKYSIPMNVHNVRNNQELKRNVYLIDIGKNELFKIFYFETTIPNFYFFDKHYIVSFPILCWHHCRYGLCPN